MNTTKPTEPCAAAKAAAKEIQEKLKAAMSEAFPEMAIRAFDEPHEMALDIHRHMEPYVKAAEALKRYIKHGDKTNLHACKVVFSTETKELRAALRALTQPTHETTTKEE